MWFQNAVDSIFWAFCLQLMFLFIDMFSNTHIASLTFTWFGFLILYFSAYVCVASLRLD